MCADAYYTMTPPPVAKDEESGPVRESANCATMIPFSYLLSFSLFFLLLFFSLHQPRSVFPPCSHRLQAPAVHSSVACGLNCITTLRFLTILSPLPLSPSLLHPLRLKAAPKKTAVPSFLEGHRVAARDATYFGFIMLIFYLCDGAQVLNIQQKS